MKILVAKSILDNKQFLNKFQDKIEERLAKDRTTRLSNIYDFIEEVFPTAAAAANNHHDIKLSEKQAINNIQPYITWLISRYANGAISLAEDISQVTEDLLLFDAYKKKGLIQGADKDIGRYKRPSDLSEIVEKIKKSRKKIRESKIPETLKGGDVTIHYEDNSHVVVTPHNFDVSKILGSRNWCTAGSKNLYKEYTEHGPLYIVLIKDGEGFKEEKYQLHFASQQFMDRRDVPDLDRIKQFSFLYRLFTSQPEFNDNLSRKDQVAAFMATFLYQDTGGITTIHAADAAYARLEKIKNFDVVAAFEAANRQSDLFGDIVTNIGISDKYTDLVSVSWKHHADLLIHLVKSFNLLPLSALSAISLVDDYDDWKKDLLPLFKFIEKSIPTLRLDVDQYIENAMERYRSDRVIPDKEDFKKKLGSEFVDFWGSSLDKRSEDSLVMDYFLDDYLDLSMEYVIAVMVVGHEENNNALHFRLKNLNIDAYDRQDTYLFIHSIITGEYFKYYFESF